MITEYTLTKNELKIIIQRHTDPDCDYFDADNDKEALKDIVAKICTDGDIVAAADLITSWRKEKIEQIYDNEYE